MRCIANCIRLMTLTLLLSLVLGCEPSSIRPIPSPLDPPPPIETSIIVSSLTAAEESPSEELVALVGIDGAVIGAGEIRITNTRKSGSVLYEATDEGAFVATVLALAGDELAISYIDKEGSESEPLALLIQTYESPLTKGDDQVDPGTDEAAFAGTEANDSNEPPTSPAGGSSDLNGDGDAEAQVVQLTLIYIDGTVRLVGGSNFIGANDVLILANETSGGVHSTTADSYGAIDVSFPAEIGDLIVLFSTNPLNSNLTSPAVKFIVTEGTQSADGI